MDLSLPSGIFQCVWFLGQPRAPRSLKCARERHRFGPSCTDVKRRDESSFILLKRMLAEPSVANHECLNQSRVKNGIDGLMQYSTQALHCNPTITCGLITKRTLTQLTSI
ncbi:hypothetical protein TNCV_1324831 [Trichonephila clavipes]|nr:hypothetical protein TNCV_1324831 [Trichonephila clavipes]